MVFCMWRVASTTGLASIGSQLSRPCHEAMRSHGSHCSSALLDKIQKIGMATDCLPAKRMKC